MPKTQLVVPQELLDTLRTLTRNPDDEEELNSLTSAVRDLLALAPDDPRNEKEYGFMVTLRGIARVSDVSKTAALMALTEFQSVDVTVSYDRVTVTELSFVPDDVVLVDIDGNELDGRV